jgi:hypothetical protein
MQAIFETVADEFDGDTVSAEVETTQPEATLSGEIDAVRDRFDVTVGSYPSLTAHNRVKILGTDPEAVEAARDWLRDRIDRPQ